MKRSFIVVILISIFLFIFSYFIGLNRDKMTNSKNDEGERKIDILDENKTDNKEEKTTIISLYYLNPKTSNIELEKREVKIKDVMESQEKTIVEELIKGPQSINLDSIIPKETKVKSIDIADGVVTVDFSNEFNENSNDRSIFSNRIESVIKTLTEIKNISIVQIKVEGNIIN